MSEFSRPLFLRKIRKQKSKTSKITATPKECLNLSKRFSLGDIHSLEATYTIQKKGIGILFKGTLITKMTQTCVQTLEPFTTEIIADFEDLFTDHEIANTDKNNIDLNEDIFEPITGEAIDIGEVVAQHLSINIDDYPVK